MYKILFFALCIGLSYQAMASYDYSQIGIVDDFIANSIRPPRPPSVSDLLEDIKNKQPDQITDLKISFNNITLDGALKILRFSQENLPNLEYLDLSYNRIYIDEKEEAYLKFKGLFNNLKDKGIAINLFGNNISPLQINDLGSPNTDKPAIFSY